MKQTHMEDIIEKHLIMHAQVQEMQAKQLPIEKDLIASLEHVPTSPAIKVKAKDAKKPVAVFNQILVIDCVMPFMPKFDMMGNPVK
ncbi:hypothetical protein SS50377_26985 [Spironucleus salmonicida]|uniref:Uncharacterized protein n=1 Tax=Spironucleus salmonicida TaxID=348837 RepID=V6LUW5_9EUKA|nr:hypothetical protein SS50377_26985 [Spironucleus salmonicida]|eukprot:EST47496.1 Hypothetical protein SS50377_12481 [Spironucleus salmonicida]